MPVNRRRNPFTGADLPVAITGEVHTVPASGDLWVYSNEIPKQEDPETVVVRDAPTTTDIQPDGTAGVDSYVYEDTPATNQGTAIILVTGREGGPSYGRYRPLLQFDLSSLPAGDVTEAYLRMYLEAGGGGYPAANQVGIHKITATWAEGTVNYSNQPAHDPVAEDVVTAYASGWYEWSITDLVAGWVDATITNYGVMLKHADEVSSTDTARNWTSSDGTAAQRPMLRVKVAGTTYEILAATATPGPGQVAVQHSAGAFNFHSSAAGNSVTFDYNGTGSPVRAEDVGGIATLLSGGTGTDLNVLSGTTTLVPGIYRYVDMHIAPGATLTVSQPAEGPGALVICCTGDCLIEGTIDLGSKGFQGGRGGATGGRDGRPGRGFGGLGGSGGFGAPTSGTAGGGGGGGAKEVGEDGTDGTNGHGGPGGERHRSRTAYVWPWEVPSPGGGGGGAGGTSAAAGGDGGDGGGALLLQVQGQLRITSGAVITATGDAGGSPNGGGGGGGAVYLRASSRDIDITPTVTGGAGNGAGGDGSVGWYEEESL